MTAMLITGATGSVGGELVARYYGKNELFVQGRDAQKLLKLRMRYPALRLVLGDLDCHSLREAVAACDIIVHAAAQKYVDLAEKHVFYTLLTNVQRTYELADLAARKGVRKFVFVSTDKSSAPTNVYGMSKYLAERLVLELADLFPDTLFSICRFGNIFGSNGSVIRLWLDALRRPTGKIQVTDPEMTRFMFSLEEAADTVDFALNRPVSGDIIIPKMQAVRLRDLMNLFPEAPVQVIGRRPGEKQHETLYVSGEVSTGYETDRYFVLNRKAPQRLEMSTIDSSQVASVDITRLRAWFDSVRQNLAA